MTPFWRKPKPPPPKPPIPEHFERYSEMAKWLIAVSSGLLAYGMDQVKDAGPGWPLGLFLVCGVALGLTIATGALFFLSFNYYRALQENADPATALDMEDSRWWAELHFRWMIFSFAGGVALFVAFAVTLLLSASGAARPVGLQIAPLPPGGADMALVQRDGGLWTLRRDANGKLIWRPLRSPP